MKSIKEKRMIVKWARAMNEPIDPSLAEEVDKYEALQEEISQSVKSNLFTDLVQASKIVQFPVKEPVIETTRMQYPLPPSLDDLEALLEATKEELVEVVKEEPAPVQEEKPETLIDKSVKHITKELKLEAKSDSYQQPDADLATKNINDVRKKIKYLEDWIAKISLTGPGGGAGDTISLDYPVKLVTQDYTFTHKDYYVGVNATASITITIPDYIGFAGRKIVIKDESGNCASNPIVVNGTVDNDVGGFILQMNNGGIQMIYRDGWRII